MPEKSRLLAELVFSSGEIPKGWEESLILNLYKGKGGVLDRVNYLGPKLTDQVMKLLGRGTNDAIFIFSQLQEKYFATNKPFYYLCRLDKAFDRVPRKVLWWALRSVGVDEWAIRIIQGMYTNARSRVRVNGEYREEFGIGVHQGSVLSPLLFILVLEALHGSFTLVYPGSYCMLMTSR